MLIIHNNLMTNAYIFFLLKAPFTFLEGKICINKITCNHYLGFFFYQVLAKTKAKTALATPSKCKYTLDFILQIIII